LPVFPRVDGRSPRANLVAMRGRLLLCLAFALPACGGGGSHDPDAPGPTPDAPSGADADNRDLLVRLNALPGVVAVEETDPGDPSTRLFDLTITQEVDHDNPGTQTFTEDVTLIHRGFDRPMIAATTGYWNYIGYYDQELTALLDANQISIEYRYFAGSRPSPADWSYLTIEQAAADEHHVIELLKTIYSGPWIDTGASKGGMTASYHRRFWPDDVAGTVPYVAPLSFAAGDTRYADFLDTNGPPDGTCRQALRDLEVELLTQPRFDDILSRAQAEGYPYNRIAIGPAVESAITGIEWAFWQYTGATACNQIPPTNATSQEMWDFLDQVNAVSGSSDPWIDAFEPYYYQAEFQLGYPDGGGAFLAGLTRYTDADYAGLLPIGVPEPTYDPAPMQDISDWVMTSGSKLVFIYGQWDPWTAGRYDLGGATDSLSLTAPEMTHGAGFDTLTTTDRAAGYAKLAAWTGVQPSKPAAPRSGVHAQPVREPRIPPAMIRGIQLRTR
jgi:hypothetical protein